MSGATGDGWLAGHAYEAYMGRWSRRLADQFVRWLDAPPGAHWLDVGCGTGALAAAVCEHALPASVVACDPSATFVEYAQRELRDEHVAFAVAGIDELPQHEGGFDVVASALVLNFVADPTAALASMRQRLRPGGSIAACVWDYAGQMEFLRVFWDEAVACDEGAAQRHEGRRFATWGPDVLAAHFRAAGLDDVETGALEIATGFTSFDDFWSPFLQGAGPAPSYVASLDPSGRAMLRDRLSERLTGGDGRRLAMRARAWAVRGVSR